MYYILLLFIQFIGRRELSLNRSWDILQYDKHNTTTSRLLEEEANTGQVLHFSFIIKNPFLFLS